MIDEKYITNRIKQLCEKKKMSMYALSKKSGISQSSLSNLMKRRSAPSFFTLDKICDGLGITMAQFFSSDGRILDITEEQREVLQIWDSLTDQQKQAVKIYVRGMRLE